MLKLYYFIVASIPEKVKHAFYGSFGVSACEFSNHFLDIAMPQNFPIDEAIKILIQIVIGGITLYKLFKKRNKSETVLTEETELKK